MIVVHQGDLVRIDDEEEVGYLLLSSGLRGKICIHGNEIFWEYPKTFKLAHYYHTPKAVVLGVESKNPVLEWNK